MNMQILPRSKRPHVYKVLFNEKQGERRKKYFRTEASLKKKDLDSLSWAKKAKISYMHKAHEMLFIMLCYITAKTYVALN